MDSVFCIARPTVFTVVTEETAGERLRKIRESLGLGVREAARLSQGLVSHAQISNLEKDLSAWRKAQLSTVHGLALAYGRSVEQLLREVGGVESEVEEDLDAIGIRTAPVYDLVGAGLGLEGGRVIDQLDIPSSWRGEFVGYKITGQSMAPSIPEGSTVAVKVQDWAEPGQIIVCFTSEHGMLLKYFAGVTPDGYNILTSLNQSYAPLYVRDMHVKGYVYEVRTRLNGKHKLTS